MVQSLEYGLDPYGYFRRAHRRFGDVFTTHVVGEEWVMLARRGARGVRSRARRASDSGRQFPAAADPGHARNVLLLDGAEHLRRFEASPALPRRADEGLRADHRGRDRARPRGRAQAEPFAVLPHMQAITFEVILRAVFGVEEAGRLDRLRRALRELLSWTTGLAAGLVFGFLGPERVMALRGFAVVVAEVDGEVLEEIARRRTATGRARGRACCSSRRATRAASR